MKFLKTSTFCSMVVWMLVLTACGSSPSTSSLAMATPVPVENPAQAYVQSTKAAATQAANGQAAPESEVKVSATATEMEAATPEAPKETAEDVAIKVPAEAGADAAAEAAEKSPINSSVQLPAEDWMDWPIVPEVSDTARAIYRDGLAMGNNPRTFSVVGDVQNTSDIFLGLFDDPAKYKKISANIELKDTITNFDGSFDRDNYAVDADFTAESILTQGSGDPEYCLLDETPLECELRINKPAFVLISLEVWFPDRNPESYERIMRRIIEYTIAQGAVPILSTKADNIEEDHSINLTTARLALEYDLPLWNWWAAAQPLDNHGIDKFRDGFYIYEDAWPVRSLSALRVLDALWKGTRIEQEGQVYTYEHEFDYMVE